MKEVIRHANVGDTIKIVNRFTKNCSYKNGDVFNVVDVEAMADFAGNVTVKNSLGERIPICYSEYVVLEETKHVKDNIRDCTIALNREGRLLIFLRKGDGTLQTYEKYMLEEGRDCSGVNNIASFTEDMTHNKYDCYDIMAYINYSQASYALYKFLYSNLNPNSIVWDWRRKEEYTEEEKELIKAAIKLGLKYLARDYDGKLFLYNVEPNKINKLSIWGYPDSEFRMLEIDRDLFKNVKWEDNKAIDITKIRL